jgi:hypothetical protein
MSAYHGDRTDEDIFAVQQCSSHWPSIYPHSGQSMEIEDDSADCRFIHEPCAKVNISWWEDEVLQHLFGSCLPRYIGNIEVRTATPSWYLPRTKVRTCLRQR